MTVRFTSALATKELSLKRLVSGFGPICTCPSFYPPTKATSTNPTPAFEQLFGMAGY
jgi:hypothetical protein